MTDTPNELHRCMDGTRLGDFLMQVQVWLKAREGYGGIAAESES